MSGSLSDMEKDIEESRARLDQTIDRIQDRLSPVNLVDEMIGSARQTPLNGIYDDALEVVRRNPLPVLLIAAGVGMLLTKMGRKSLVRPLPRDRVPVPEPVSRPTPRTVSGPASRADAAGATTAERETG